MVKLTVKLILVIASLSFMGFENLEGRPTSTFNEVRLDFSKEAIGIESGEPVYSRTTKIWVSNPEQKEVKLFLDGNEKKMNGKRLKLSKLTSGSHTLMIVDATQATNKRTIGFSIEE